MGKQYYIDSDNPDRVLWGLSWRMVVGVIVGLLLCAGINWFTWGVKVFTSDIKGAGDQQIRINSERNRTQQQELFRTMYGKIVEYNRNIDVAYAAKVEDPSQFNKTNYTGLVMTCNYAVQDYNAQVGKVTAEKWLPADLPYVIDQNDPAFDCLETKK
jgi:hypothetical protein